MTTCPRCGRVADDEIVCADCGMSLALARRTAAVQAAHASAAAAPAGGLMDEFASDESGPDEPARDVNVLRLAAIVCITCLLAAATAVLLLHQHGTTNKHNALPFTTSSGAGSSPAGPYTSSRAGSTRPDGTTQTTPSPTPSRSKSPTASARPSTPRNRASRTSLASATRTVRVAKGSLDSGCGPHCYRLVVTLSGFSGGTHQVTCWSTHGDQLGSYSTSSSTSAGCTDRRPRDSVYAIVDNRYRSNTVSW